MKIVNIDSKYDYLIGIDGCGEEWFNAVPRGTAEGCTGGYASSTYVANIKGVPVSKWDNGAQWSKYYQ